MEHLFLPYELAIIAKQKGFNEPCINCYNADKTLMQDGWYSTKRPCYNDGLIEECSSAPLYQQITDWFREKHNFNIAILKGEDTITGEFYYCYDGGKHLTKRCKGYYEALNKAIEEAFKLI